MSAGNRTLQSLNDRIRLAAAERGADANRLRRSVAHHVVLGRLAPAGLILKGGFCMEARLPHMARGTKDLDLVGKLALTHDSEELLDALEDIASTGDTTGDFTIHFLTAQSLRLDAAGGAAWRVVTEVRVEGRPFERFPLDLIGQVEETHEGVEKLLVAAPLSAPGLQPLEVLAVDPYQHAAEKLHAYSRLYAGETPSSRVKDLVDLVLLIDAGLLANPRRLGERLRVVWRARDDASPPHALPAPPGAWTPDYAALAAQLGLSCATAEAAFDLIHTAYTAAQPDPGELQ
ncbi:nucleotidyl transferase AbiEii/AbiGii toxin family protein [Nostocoides australiense]